MGLKYRLETEIELKASAQQFYKMLKGQCHHIPKVSPAWIQDVKIHEGDWETHGSIWIWNYTAAGKAEVFKGRVEFDDENTAMNMVGLDGDFLTMYKGDGFTTTFKCTPKEGGAVFNVGVCYEKQRDGVPLPEHYMAFMIGAAKDLD